MAVQRTLILVKPDGIQRGLASEILGRLERRGLKIVGLKLLLGKTNPLNAEVGTIRGDFGLETGRNLVHGSDDQPGSAEREIGLFFRAEEVIGYSRETGAWIME
ncbi:MAG: nucleoside-diphosphate kinase [Chloroflexi bacterium]|nr:nucleoside-diphosphate kinase [Chloroflexota bacterium]